MLVNQMAVPKLVCSHETALFLHDLIFLWYDRSLQKKM